MSADIVIDVGCADWGSETSMGPLIKRFRPRFLYGFDPTPAYGARRRGFTQGGTRVEILNAAAWTYDGTEYLIGAGTRGSLLVGEWPEQTERHEVETIDLARFIEDLDAPVILKLDCEGCEYQLLTHLISTGAVRSVERVLVEWHHPEMAGREVERAALRLALERHGVDVEEW